MPDLLAASPAAVRPRNEVPVQAVGDQRLVLARGAEARYFASPCTASVQRIVIILHGRLRDADAYLHAAEDALAIAASAQDDATVTGQSQAPLAEHTLILSPQFLATADIAAHALPAQTLHWEWTSWMGGDDAEGPVPLSSFDVIDALIALYADRARYPDLRDIVIAGHSGGAQVVHRYAILGQAALLCDARGIRCRFMIANPSSYVYFDPSRPCAPEGPPCTGFDDWKYGIHALPRYAQDANIALCEQRYLHSDVVYLLGQADNDPQHQALDRSCAAMRQGTNRLARGRNYYHYLQARAPALSHQCHEIPGVGHQGDAMLASVAGIEALFDMRTDEARIAAARTARAARTTGGAGD